MWTLGVEPSRPVLQTGALPSKLSPRSRDVRETFSAASGTGTRDLLRDKQALCLPELWRRRTCSSLVKEPTAILGLKRRVEDSNLRDPFRGLRISSAASWTAR